MPRKTRRDVDVSAYERDHLGRPQGVRAHRRGAIVNEPEPPSFHALRREPTVHYPWGDVPRTLYHGTPSKFVPSIRKQGLLVGTHERANFPDFAKDSPGNISLADTEKAARFFGAAAAMQAGDPDIDFTVLIVDAEVARTVGGVAILASPGTLDESYGGTEYVALNNIPPDAIKGYIHVYRDPVEKRVVTERGWY